MTNVVVIGAGQAGGRVALCLRRGGFDGTVALIGAEALPPYERPPLSKTVLTAGARIEDGFLAAAQAYAGIELGLGIDATAIDPGARRVALSDGGTIAYDKLIVATGAEPRRLGLEGAELSGVQTLRSGRDAEALRDRLTKGPLVVAGGGLIGLEVAASARSLGCEVTVIEAQSRVLGRSVPAATAAAIAALHAARGVKLRTGIQIEAFEGGDSVAAVRLAGGESLPAATVLVGIGVTPRTALAKAAGLAVDDGILADAICRTSDPHVFAVGDCARAFLPRYGRQIRLESYQNADRQAEAVAQTLLGSPAPYDPVPWHWSDQFDWTLQCAGLFETADEFVSRPIGEEGESLLFALAQGALSGVAGFGPLRLVAQPVRLAQMMIEQGKTPSAEDLANPGMPLKKLMKAA